MAKSKRKSKTSPVLRKGGKVAANDKNKVQQGEDEAARASLLERVQKESQEWSAGRGKKRELARMAFGLWMQIPIRYRGAPDAVLTMLGIEGDMLDLARIGSVGKFGEACNV